MRTTIRPAASQAGVDERDEVAGALERGGVVVVEEEAVVGLERLEGIERAA